MTLKQVDIAVLRTIEQKGWNWQVINNGPKKKWYVMSQT